MSEIQFLIRIAVCFGLSFLVGIERQYRRRSVGLRTTILVSLGAVLFVSFSYYVNTSDMTRIAAQVVTGIGFLGAGVIIKDGINVRGLTTAATLWCDAAIGVLCTGGFLFEAIVGTLIILFANIILRFVNQKINNRRNTKIVYSYSLKILCKENVNVIMKLLNNFMKDERIGIDNIETSTLDNGNNSINVKFSLFGNNVDLVEEVMRKFSISKDVLSFSITREGNNLDYIDEEL